MVTTRTKSASATPHSKPFEIGLKATATATATAKTPISPPTTSTTLVPSSLKSVLLSDWWLVRADAGGRKGLAVGGLVSRERAGFRVFSSAAISKRHEATILEGSDGIIITISGFINRSRTHENGFPPRVCNHFLLGFPFNWQEFEGYSSDEKSVSQGVEACTSHSDCKSENRNLEHFAVTRLRDLLLSTYGESGDCIFMKSSKPETSSPMANVESTPTETTESRDKVNSCQDNEDSPEAAEVAKSEMDIDIQVPVRGISTRSMAGSTKSKNKRQRCEENDSQWEERIDSQREERIDSQREDRIDFHREERIRSFVASRINHWVRADEKANANAGKAEGRRSSLRLRNRKQIR